MDVHQTFTRDEWIGQGRAWATAPHGLKKIAAGFFLIPQVHEHELLPSPFLPIAKLLEFRLPLQNATVTAPQPAQYFSTIAPDIDDAALMLRVGHLAIPDTKTVNKLFACSCQCWLDGVQSVIYNVYDDCDIPLEVVSEHLSSGHLELYTVLAEHDKAGFPLSYCLLSTTGTDDLGKRKKALEAWTRKLRHDYGFIPVFIHVDKDMAKDVWKAKIQLCWWHFRRAVRTPYNSQRAHAEFAFIDPLFKPLGRADPTEHEGGFAPLIFGRIGGRGLLLARTPPFVKIIESMFWLNV
ncbi:hypothetical protein B0H14DRAFT_3431182 [Mycena olivaceomarginata]|nr:hypothetical protein B0H14DRAFT_3431182 [Mycena olivaceomarginata]